MSDKTSDIHVPFGLHVWSGAVSSAPGLWSGIGNFETLLLKDDLKDISVKKPVFITGLARGGSTLLLEIMNGVTGAATHRYADYPFLYTPYFWNVFLGLMPRVKEKPAERAHGDRLMITSHSPEAMEEVLWMGFFKDAHDPLHSNVLTHVRDDDKFAQFYTDHIRKLLYVRKARRYVAKNNNNITRIAYLQALFSDARFVVPVRDPVTHIVSLMRQHERFSKIHAKNKRGLNHMQRVGHFEFGLDRRPINAGNDYDVAQIQQCWNNGEEVKGWALYWVHLYGALQSQIKNNDELSNAVQIVRYEDLCENPQQQLSQIADHCDLEMEADYIKGCATNICAPAYYDVNLDARDIAMIKDITSQTARLYGYS